jgi:hypothetical protein
MALTTRQYLRQLDKNTLKKLFKLADLEEDEYWLLYYAYVEKRMRENTCMKLNIRTTKYATLLNQALIKVDFKIKELDKIRSL